MVQRLSKLRSEVDFELILVNNGSVDDSCSVLEQVISEYGEFVRVVTIEKNLGYGHGILTGLQQARADVLAYSHADIQTPPEDVIKAYNLFRLNISNNAGVLVKGLRVNRRKEEHLFTRYLSVVSALILGYNMDDINGQPKVFSRILLEYLIRAPKDFAFDVYLMYVGQLIGLKLVTFPVDFGRRVHGESNWSSGFVKKYQTILGYLLSILKMGIKHRLFRRIKPVFSSHNL